MKDIAYRKQVRAAQVSTRSIPVRTQSVTRARNQTLPPLPWDRIGYARPLALYSPAPSPDVVVAQRERGSGRFDRALDAVMRWCVRP